MSKIKNIAAFILLLEAAGCSTTAQVSRQSPLGAQDVNAITAAYQLIQFDLAECQVINTGSASPAIVALSSKICQDATAYQTKLQTIATQNNVTLPTTLRYDLNSEYVQLHYHLGGATDTAYLRDQIGSHETALAIFQDEAANGVDPQVKALSTQALPVVQGNLNALQAALTAEK